VSGFVHINADRIIHAAEIRVVAGIDDANEELAERARNRAPERRNSKQIAARAVPQGFVPVGKAEIVRRTPRGTIERITTAGFDIKTKGERKTPGGSFRIGFELTGRSATARDRAEVRRGTIGSIHFSRSRGLRIRVGGTLKRSIHAIPATREGDVIRGTVRAEAPYSIYVERGFTHKGGGHIPGKKFLRTSHAEVAGQLARGDYW
jgi:hypothetical protein